MGLEVVLVLRPVGSHLIYLCVISFGAAAPVYIKLKGWHRPIVPLGSDDSVPGN